MNPFEQLAQRKPSIASARPATVKSSILSICDDQYPEKRPSSEGKYVAFFRQMKPGQCLKCDPKEVQRISGAMRKWIKEKGKDGQLMVKVVTTFPKDGKGRVWMMAKDPLLAHPPITPRH